MLLFKSFMRYGTPYNKPLVDNDCRYEGSDLLSESAAGAYTTRTSILRG
jgi:hypothetical protein